jgi:hypothetical protein
VAWSVAHQKIEPDWEYDSLVVLNDETGGIFLGVVFVEAVEQQKAADDESQHCEEATGLGSWMDVSLNLSEDIKAFEVHFTRISNIMEVVHTTVARDERKTTWVSLV